MCALELMNGRVLQTLPEQLKVPGSRLEGSELKILRKHCKHCRKHCIFRTKDTDQLLPSNLEPGTFNCSRE